MENAAGAAQPGAQAGVPRLMIQKMVLENFKSYAGVIEIGPFHKVRNAMPADICATMVRHVMSCEDGKSAAPRLCASLPSLPASALHTTLSLTSLVYLIHVHTWHLSLMRPSDSLLQCFSSVVGPNGSGKSNVIDALLFVFGRRAKAIRQGKLAELIHNSEKFKDLQYCKVSVHFCDIIDKVSKIHPHETQIQQNLDGDQTTSLPPMAALSADTGCCLSDSVSCSLPLNTTRAFPSQGDDYETVPGSELVVARKADRKSVSTYYVNDKPVKLDEVTTLLKARGIDLDHNRFLILQVRWLV